MTAETRTDLHPRERETGRCRTCKELWPCEMAREELLGQLKRGDADRTALAMWLSSEMFDQLHAEPAGDADGLRRRFLRWLPKRSETDRRSVPPGAFPV